MSTLGLGSPEPGPDRDSGELQFERAEYSGGHSGPACCTCQRAAESEYHQLNGRVFCTSCRAQIEQSMEHMHRSGSLLRATGFGLGAAILGALIYYAVSAITGYQFGLMAVVVGWLVGKAVRKGSGSLGGRRYQVLAVILTYLAIASIYVPPISKAAFAAAEKRQQVEKQSGATLTRATPALPASFIGLVFYAAIFIVLVFGFALAAPILGGFQHILGVVIIGFGLWEAWKFNRRVEVHFTGPFAVAGAQPAPGA